MDVMQIISQTTVPIIFISAIGLITLSLQNRYGRVKDGVYVFQKQKIIYTKNGEKQKARKAEIMLKAYQRDAKIIKNSMLAAFTSILFIAVTSFLIMIQGLANYPMQIPIIISFFLAILALVVSVILIIISFVNSIRLLNYEVEKDELGVRYNL